jgi:catechol 2,3-dioxygenase-like lactoylglutathione lyase family enzyme
MSNEDLRPPIWIGHVVLETDRLEASAQFMRTIGMRPVHQGPDVAIFELRGGTHLILTAERGYPATRGST